MLSKQILKIKARLANINSWNKTSHIGEHRNTNNYQNKTCNVSLTRHFYFSMNGSLLGLWPTFKVGNFINATFSIEMPFTAFWFPIWTHSFFYHIVWILQIWSIYCYYPSEELVSCLFLRALKWFSNTETNDSKTNSHDTLTLQTLKACMIISIPSKSFSFGL